MNKFSWFHRLTSWIKSRLVQDSGLPRIGMNRKTAIRVLLVANAYIPTLQIWFVHPLEEYYKRGKIFTQILTEQKLKEKFGKGLYTPAAATYVNNLVDEYIPDVVIFCRYSGPHVDSILAAAKKVGAKTIFHIDDDLLNIPLELGEKKYAFHNHFLRLESVRKLLNDTDMVFCSTAPLAERLASYGLQAPIRTGKLSSWGEVVTPPVRRGEGGIIKIGYMGFDHDHDLRVALDGLTGILDRYPNVIFELFGKIRKPAELERFDERIILHPSIFDYNQFLKELAAKGWTIGICPLAATSFNRLKSINKWIEYTSVGAAVVATGGFVYDDCCADGRGIIVDSSYEWEGALSRLIEHPDECLEMVRRAQQELSLSYSREEFGLQMMELICV